jgi:hypothetical protein
MASSNTRAPRCRQTTVPGSDNAAGFCRRPRAPPRSHPYPHQTPIKAKAEFASLLDSPSRFPACLCSALFTETSCHPRQSLPSPTSKGPSPSRRAPITKSSCQTLSAIGSTSPSSTQGAPPLRSDSHCRRPLVRPNPHRSSSPKRVAMESPVGELSTSPIPHNLLPTSPWCSMPPSPPAVTAGWPEPPPHDMASPVLRGGPQGRVWPSRQSWARLEASKPQPSAIVVHHNCMNLTRFQHELMVLLGP